MAGSRNVLVGTAAALLALLLFSSSGPSTTTTRTAFHDPAEMSRMLHDQLELKKRIDGLKQELKVEPAVAAPIAVAPTAVAPTAVKPTAVAPPVEATRAPARAAKLVETTTVAKKLPAGGGVATLGTAKPRPCWQGEGCGEGTCNEDLGRCDCPPFKKGPKCAKPLFPACVDQVS